MEPEGFDDTKRSLELGNRVENNPDARSICHAILTPTPGQKIFAIHRRLLSGAFSVSDEMVKQALKILFTDLKLAVEPGGAFGLAALLSDVCPLQGRTVVVVLSGGNIALETLYLD